MSKRARVSRSFAKARASSRLRESYETLGGGRCQNAQLSGGGRLAMATVDFRCDRSRQETVLCTHGSTPSAVVMRRWRSDSTGSSSFAGARPNWDSLRALSRLSSDDVGTVVAFLLSIGIRPFVELSFMPTALASGSKTVFHYRGNVTPPKDYKQWSTLIHALVTHWVGRSLAIESSANQDSGAVIGCDHNSGSVSESTGLRGVPELAPPTSSLNHQASRMPSWQLLAPATRLI